MDFFSLSEELKARLDEETKNQREYVILNLLSTVLDRSELIGELSLQNRNDLIQYTYELVYPYKITENNGIEVII